VPTIGSSPPSGSSQRAVTFLCWARFGVTRNASETGVSSPKVGSRYLLFRACGQLEPMIGPHEGRQPREERSVTQHEAETRGSG